MNDLNRKWTSEGYIIVRGLIDRERIERTRVLCEDVLQQWYRRDPETGAPGLANGTTMFNVIRPEYFRQHPERLAEILELTADRRALDVASAIFGEEPLFRSTSLWFNPKETSRDGNWHRDSQFTTKSDEEEKQFLFGGSRSNGVQLQVALVPSEDSEVVPGSHLRWDTDEEYRIRKGDGGKNNTSNAMPGAVRASLQPGDAVAFNPLTLHRGRYHSDKRRLTFMMTYTTTDNAPLDYFSTQPWFLEEGYLNGLTPAATAFFQRFIDTFKSGWEPSPPAISAGTATAIA